MISKINDIMMHNTAAIESWFQEQWQQTPPPLTSSIDLRNAHFKLSHVDTNLFPAGFNNLHETFLPTCIQSAKKTLNMLLPKCNNILLIPENHTRNNFYLEHLYVLQQIFIQAGFNVRIGSLDPQYCQTWLVNNNQTIIFEPLMRQNNKLLLENFDPSIILLNNDLSTGIPEILQNLIQPIMPTAQLGWSTRSKANHFFIFNQIVTEFSQQLSIDPWLLSPYSIAVNNIDFISKTGIEKLIDETAQLLHKITTKYQQYNINEPPFIVIKADNGTYGMNVMMINDIQTLHTLNRKQRTRMSASKGGNVVNKVIVQEGVYTTDKTTTGDIAEPVIYMIGEFVVGSFYRAHQNRSNNDNLNTPGMYFHHSDLHQDNNYTYGVNARLAALAAAHEIAHMERLQNITGKFSQ